MRTCVWMCEDVVVYGCVWMVERRQPVNGSEFASERNRPPGHLQYNATMWIDFMHNIAHYNNLHHCGTKKSIPNQSVVGHFEGTLGKCFPNLFQVLSSPCCSNG